MKTMKTLITGSLVFLLTTGASSEMQEAPTPSDLEATYHRFREIAHRTACNLTRDGLQAEELAHDTATHLLVENRNRLKLLSRSRKEQARIVKIATRNRLLDILKKERRHGRRLEAAAASASPRAETHRPDAIAIEAEELAVRTPILERLAGKNEVVKRYLDGHRISEIQSDLNISRYKIGNILKSAAREYRAARRAAS